MKGFKQADHILEGSRQLSLNFLQFHFSLFLFIYLLVPSFLSPNVISTSASADPSLQMFCLNFVFLLFKFLRVEVTSVRLNHHMLMNDRLILRGDAHGRSGTFLPGDKRHSGCSTRRRWRNGNFRIHTVCN